MPHPTQGYPPYEFETELVYTLGAQPDDGPVPKGKGACARNLSEGELLLEAEERLPVGTRLTLFLIRGKQGAIEIPGEVVWAEEAAIQRIFPHRVRILQMESTQHLAWKSFREAASREVRRRSLRFDVDFPITCRRKDSGEHVGGRAVAVNVSRGGFLVLLSVRIPVDTALSLEVRSSTQSLKTEARVVRIEEARPDGLIPHGLAFADTAEGSRLLPQLFLLG